MAEWLYEIQRINTVSEPQLEKLLLEQGEKGWELVQVLPSNESAKDGGYQVIFKMPKRLIADRP